jgi:hypothetical protein
MKSFSRQYKKEKPETIFGSVWLYLLQFFKLQKQKIIPQFPIDALYLKNNRRQGFQPLTGLGQPRRRLSALPKNRNRLSAVD